MPSNNEKHIITSWLQNAKPWIQAITNDEIESRQLTTNEVIVNTLLKKAPKKVMDIGCGEGWLARVLHESGIKVHGIDIVPELVDEAKRLGGGSFQVLPYEDLPKGVIKEKFDVVVCNFSLLGNESVNHIFQSVKHLLNDNGFFIIQTIHPIAGCGEAEYKDGWRAGSWAGFNPKFTNPPPWYFRTLETWKSLFMQYEIRLSEILEPVNPKTGTFASIIFIGEVIK